MNKESNIQIETSSKEMKLKFPQNFINHFKNYNWVRWVGFVGFLIYLVTLGLTITNIVNDLTGERPWEVLFGILDRFTYQSNLLLLFFSIFWLFMPNHSFVKDNKFLLACMVYIFFTFFGYNVVLVGISGDRGYDTSNAYSFVNNFWVHIFTCLYFVGFGFCVMYTQPNKQPLNFFKSLLKMMIYPTIYVIYVSSIPFVFNAPVDENGNYYSWFMSSYFIRNTNNTVWTYSVYGTATNLKNYPIAAAYILIMWLVFFPGVYTGFYFSWKGFNKLNNKKQSN